MTEIKIVDQSKRFEVDTFNLRVGDIFATGSDRHSSLFIFSQIERDGVNSYDLIELSNGVGIPYNSLDITLDQSHELIGSLEQKSAWEFAIAERLMTGELREVEKIEIEYIEK